MRRHAQGHTSGVGLRDGTAPPNPRSCEKVINLECLDPEHPSAKMSPIKAESFCKKGEELFLKEFKNWGTELKQGCFILKSTGKEVHSAM